MAEEKIIERLMGFGLTREEAMVYIFLLRAGPCPARLLANKLGGNRMKAYRTLKTLQERGLVEVTLGRPVKFVAAPLDSALNNLIETYRSKLSSMEESKKEILEYWSRLPTTDASIGEPKFRILQGRQQVYDLLLKMFDRAKSEVRILTTRNDLYRLSFAGLDGKLRRLGEKGIKLKILTQLDVQGVEVVSSYLSFAEVRNISLPAILRLVTVDECESLTTFVMDDSMSMTTDEDSGLWTDASNYVKAMNASFWALWNNSSPIQEILPKLMAQQELMEGLNLTKRSLESMGWSAEVPGKIIGESGVEHTFSMVARGPGMDKPVVVDLLTEDKPMYQLLTMNLKLLDVKLSQQFLVSYRPLDEKELRLARQYSIQPIVAERAEEVSKKIIDEMSSLVTSGPS
ncbi:MAG: hypothetical protein HA492_03925 [Candidatus Verstraetearchaeota archaeon]|uniref:Transcription regulator TrmB N-terminal domain-containing protein n=1 Tax=Candidatus Methanosuratincola petrocarbonis (ex Vanwonterghem et al. 2016) TaxID=1867261 RepID=A0A7J3UYF4_9CREN|nr:hypothetical protein [Candidatus Methanomethylicia archaeon]NHV60536.1 hypothetical protein [Candidatus Verstraetearchaeota archaeon]